MNHFFLLLCALSVNLALAAEWEFVSRDDGVTIYKKEIPGTEVIAFKGEGEIDAPPLKVVSVILDYANIKKWVDDMEQVKIISHESDLKWVEYSHFGTPFVIKDRDFVTKVEIKVEQKTGEIELKQISVDEKDYPVGVPKSSFIRGKVLDGKFILKPVADGKKTQLIGELQADPMGSVPKWMVNFIQQSWPRRTLKALRKRVAEVVMEPHPAVMKALMGGSAIEALKGIKAVKGIKAAGQSSVKATRE